MQSNQSRPVNESEDAIPYAKNYTTDETHSNMVRVYVHHVKPTDTLPFILLAYGTTSEKLHQSNRLWHSDSIFTRKVLYLLVADCSVDSDYIPSIGQTHIELVPVDQLSYFPTSTNRASSYGGPSRQDGPRDSTDSGISVKSASSALNITSNLEVKFNKVWRDWKRRKWEQTQLRESVELE
jgi:hypothetical protein